MKLFVLLRIYTSSLHGKTKKTFKSTGIFGFDHLEPVILASLVAEDPLLLIGRSGSGKTILLNKIAEIFDRKRQITFNQPAEVW